MTLTSVNNGSQLLTGSDVALFTKATVLNHYTVKIYLDDLVANDKVIITTLDEDINDNVDKSYRTTTVVGVVSDPVHLINWIPSTGFTVTVRQINGSFKTITWELLSSS